MTGTVELCALFVTDSSCGAAVNGAVSGVIPWSIRVSSNCRAMDPVKWNCELHGAASAELEYRARASTI